MLSELVGGRTVGLLAPHRDLSAEDLALHGPAAAGLACSFALMYAMMLPTVLPRSVNATITVAPMSPPAIAYSTTVSPSSPCHNATSALLTLFISSSPKMVLIRFVANRSSAAAWAHSRRRRRLASRTALRSIRTRLQDAVDS